MNSEILFTGQVRLLMSVHRHFSPTVRVLYTALSSPSHCSIVLIPINYLLYDHENCYIVSYVVPLTDWHHVAEIDVFGII